MPKAKAAAMEPATGHPRVFRFSGPAVCAASVELKGYAEARVGASRADSLLHQDSEKLLPEPHPLASLHLGPSDEPFWAAAEIALR